MGRDWHHWGGKSSKKAAGESSAAGKHPPPPPPAGCMAAVFHLFHSRGLHLPPQTPDDDDPRGLQPAVKSAVAEEVVVGATAAETEPEGDKNSNNRVGVETGEFTSGRFITAINTKKREGDSTSDSRTPGLVARLMGLDLFPDSDPPRTSGRSGPDGRVLNRFGERRLSMQVRRGAKEVSVELSRHSCSEIGGERRSVRGSSAREVVEKVKETAGRRRFGDDMTNRVGEKQGKEQRRDEFLMSRGGTDAKKGVGSDKSGSPRARVLEEPTSDTKHVSWSDLYTSSRKQQQVLRAREQKPVTRNYHDPTKENDVSVGRQPRLSKREEQFLDVVVAHNTTRLTKRFERKPEKSSSKGEVCRGTLASRLFLSRKLEKEKQDHPCKATTKRKSQPTKLVVAKALQHRTDAHAPPLPPPPPPATPPFVVAADTNKDTCVSARDTRPTCRAQISELSFQETRTVLTKMRESSPINYTDLRDVNVIFGLDHSEPGPVLVDPEREEEEEVVREIEREIVDNLVHDTFVGVLW